MKRRAWGRSRQKLMYVHKYAQGSLLSAHAQNHDATYDVGHAGGGRETTMQILVALAN